MLAMLLVRHDMAPLLTALAAEVGFAFKRMNLAAPRDVALTRRPTPRTKTLH
jgi:hypothetical protein